MPSMWGLALLPALIRASPNYVKCDLTSSRTAGLNVMTTATGTVMGFVPMTDDGLLLTAPAKTFTAGGTVVASLNGSKFAGGAVVASAGTLAVKADINGVTGGKVWDALGVACTAGDSKACQTGCGTNAVVTWTAPATNPPCNVTISIIGNKHATTVGSGARGQLLRTSVVLAASGSCGVSTTPKPTPQPTTPPGSPTPKPTTPQPTALPSPTPQPTASPGAGTSLGSFVATPATVVAGENPSPVAFVLTTTLPVDANTGTISITASVKLWDANPTCVAVSQGGIASGRPHPITTAVPGAGSVASATGGTQLVITMGAVATTLLETLVVTCAGSMRANGAVGTVVAFSAMSSSNTQPLVNQAGWTTSGPLTYLVWGSAAVNTVAEGQSPSTITFTLTTTTALSMGPVPGAITITASRPLWKSAALRASCTVASKATGAAKANANAAIIGTPNAYGTLSVAVATSAGETIVITCTDAMLPNGAAGVSALFLPLHFTRILLTV